MDKISGSNRGHHFHGTHYVISEDVDLIVSRWCRSIGITPPAKGFYLGLRSRMKDFLQKLFARVTFIDGQEIRHGLLNSIALHKKAKLTVVSLERAYLEDSEVDDRIELTRTVDQSCGDVVIHGVRHGTPEKRLQFGGLREKKIALIDDVVFTGNTAISIISSLHYVHANVHAITVAVGVKEGIDHLKKATFGVVGMPEYMTINCLEEFDDVSDQVCERDFYPGIPYSGREFAFGDSSFPYILPFGKLNKWASIPEKELKRFSVLCINNTIALFEEIERLNHRMITCAMVPRPVFGFPRDKTKFTSHLKEARTKCMAM